MNNSVKFVHKFIKAFGSEPCKKRIGSADILEISNNFKISGNTENFKISNRFCDKLKISNIPISYSDFLFRHRKFCNF